MSKGYLVAFIGIDGSGKSTQTKLLVESLEHDGIRVSHVWSRWEPLVLRPLIKIWKNRSRRNIVKSSRGVHDIKDKKQKLLSNSVLRWLWLISFFIDYGLQIFVKIRTKLFKKKLVISDRVFYDSLIDQAINLGKRREGLLKNLDSFWMKIFFPQPDMVIYIDCPENIAFSRKNDAPDIEYLTERRELYLKLADKYKWIKIDGTLPVDVVAGEIKKLVYEKLAISENRL